MTATDTQVVAVLEVFAAHHVVLSVFEARKIAERLVPAFGAREARQPYTGWTEAEKTKVVDLYLAGEPVGAIAETLGRSRRSVIQYLERHNVRRPA